ncbi:MAG: hypothetical protein HYU64_06370 [Armatimonadetes bacterium]|nr:hypothetical protein [Armatimonadota bacterium]
MEIQDTTQKTSHHSPAARKRFEKSGMPDNWYWNTVQDNFDKTREERVEKRGETAGKILNYLATPLDWKRAKDTVDKQNMESLARQLHVTHQGKDKAHLSLDLMEAASRSIEAREAQNARENFKQILIGTGSTEAEAEEEIRKIHQAAEEKLAGMSELQKAAMKAQGGARAASYYGAVRDAKESLDNLLKTAKASKDERAVQILHETSATLKSELQDEQKYKVLMACYSALQDDPKSPKGLLSHLAGNLWSEDERFSDKSVRAYGATRSLDILLETASSGRASFF